MEISKRELILGFACIGCAFLFFVLGVMYANYNIYEMINSIQIQNLQIDLNETQLADRIYNLTMTNFQIN